MHACNTLTLDQLLTVRDGAPVDANVMHHAENCVVCAKELARLRELQASLKALPALAAPAYDGAALQVRLRAARTYRAAGITIIAGVGILTMLLITMVHGSRSNIEIAMTSDTLSQTVATSEAEPTVNSLVIRSQELESRLRQLPRRPRIERASTSTTIDTLQNHIQWVDYRLSLANDVGMTERQSARLWQDRVELMDSLLKVRYAEAQRATFLPTGSSRSSR